MKKPRASPCTAGLTRTGPSSCVLSCSMARGSLTRQLERLVGTVADHAGDRERRGGGGGGGVAHVERAARPREHEVVHERSVTRQRLRPDPRGAGDQVGRREL